MKKLFIILCTVVFFAASCDRYGEIWDELREHEQRIEQLEKQCRELNSNVEAIQTILTAIQQNDYVTEIMKIVEDGVEVGYSLAFAKGGIVNIYHGTNGSNGSTPKIGVQKASDGAYYWTADGEWLTNEDGDMIPATVSKPDGGYATPQFRVADGVWYVSYDNGNSWREIEAPESNNAQFFKSIRFDETSVYIELVDGTVLTVPRSKESGNSDPLYGYTQIPLSYEPSAWSRATVAANGIGAEGSKTDRLAYTTCFEIPVSQRIKVVCADGYQWGVRSGASAKNLANNQFWLWSGDELQLPHTPEGGKFYVVFRKSNLVEYPFSRMTQPSQVEEITRDDIEVMKPCLYFKDEYSAEFDTSDYRLVHKLSTETSAWISSTVGANGPNADGSSNTRLAYNIALPASLLQENDVIMVTCSPEYQWGVRSSKDWGTTYPNNSYWYNSGTAIRLSYSGTAPLTFGTATDFYVIFRKATAHNAVWSDEGAQVISKENIPEINASIYTAKDYRTGSDAVSTEVKTYFLNEIEKTKATVKSLMTEPCLVFPLVTDIHYMYSPERPESFDDCINNMLELSKYFNFDFVACLGDMIQGNTPQSTSQKYADHILTQFARIDAPFYPCVGNHDDNRYYSSATFTHTQLFMNYIRNTKDVVCDRTSMCGTNYYKDFPELELRCIFLNANTTGQYGYSYDTCNWFDEVVEDSPYRFLVFTHISPAPEHNLKASLGDIPGNTRISETCQNSDKFIMLFSGHNHYDATFTEPFMACSVNNQKFENNSGYGSSYWPAGAVNPKRTLGNATEDCFDVVVVRPGSKKINLVRFGAGEDRALEYEN